MKIFRRRRLQQRANAQLDSLELRLGCDRANARRLSTRQITRRRHTYTFLSTRSNVRDEKKKRRSINNKNIPDYKHQLPSFMHQKRSCITIKYFVM